MIVNPPKKRRRRSNNDRVTFDIAHKLNTLVISYVWQFISSIKTKTTKLYTTKWDHFFSEKRRRRRSDDDEEKA